MAKNDPSNPFGIVFSDEAPPAPRERVTEDWTGPAEVLRMNPGKWGRLKTYDDAKKAQTRAFTFKKGTKAFPQGEFEFRYVSDKDSNTSELWGCYTGPSETAA